MKKIFPLYTLVLILASGCAKYAEETQKILTIVAAGDVNFGSDWPIDRTAGKNERDFFRNCKKIIQKADISFFNLETVLCEKGQPAKYTDGKKSFVFRASPDFADVISDAGFDVVSIANNHIRDFGIYGENETKKALMSRGVKFLSIDGDTAGFVVNGRTILFTGYTSGNRERSIVNQKFVFEEIKKLSQECDILVVSFHAGAEGESALHTADRTEFFLGENRGNPVSLARGAIDNGADLVLMHGPHVPRAIEIYKERLIAYSLGNFVNYGWSLNKYTAIAPLFWIELFPDGRLCGLKIYSFVQKKPGYPEFDNSFSAYKLIKKLTEQDFNGKINFTNQEEK